MTKGADRPIGRRMQVPSDDALTVRLAERLDALSPAAQRVAVYIDRNRASALAASALQLAEATGTSDATVIRAVQALGFKGLSELKGVLVAAMAPAQGVADDMRRTLEDTGPDVARAIRLVIETHDEALHDLRTAAGQAAIAEAVTVLVGADRIVTFGIGPSASLAQYASRLLRRSGRPSRALDVTGTMLADQLLDLRRGDALLALAYGRPHREAITIFAEARRLGLPCVLITDDPAGKLATSVRLVVTVARGRTARVALHAATLVALEAIVLGLAAAAPDAALATLRRLTLLRKSVSGQDQEEN